MLLILILIQIAVVLLFLYKSEPMFHDIFQFKDAESQNQSEQMSLCRQFDVMECVIQDQDGFSSELRDHLCQLLELIDRVRMAAESRTGGRSGLLNQVCTSAALDAALDEMDREYELQRRHLNYSFDDASSSDLDSFVSALDVCFTLYFLASLYV